MSYFLSELISPLGLSYFLLLCAAILTVLRWRILARLLLLGALLTVSIFSLPRVADGLLHRLENEYPTPLLDTLQAVDIIVLLTGGVEIPHGLRHRAELGARGDRLQMAFELHQRNIASYILISGRQSPERNTASESVTNDNNEAFYSKQILTSWGVPADAIILENQSLDTRQSTKKVHELLTEIGAQSIALVTSGYHMPRAMDLFSHYPTINTVPVSANTFIGEPPTGFHWQQWLPRALSLSGSTLAIREYLGSLYNRLVPPT